MKDESHAFVWVNIPSGKLLFKNLYVCVKLVGASLLPLEDIDPSHRVTIHTRKDLVESSLISSAFCHLALDNSRLVRITGQNNIYISPHQ